MAKSLLADAFNHHIWATEQLIDVCAGLTAEQLQAPVPGIYGSILDTMRHLVGADAGYLFTISGGKHPMIDEDRLDLDALRAAIAANGAAWQQVLAGDLDPDTVVTRHRDDGTASHAPLGIRLAQVVHHGTDHRSQICTALTALGVEPPWIDVWDFGATDGRVYETPAS